MERLTKDPDAQGVLRSALWSQPGHDRVVTWTPATGGPLRFIFRGGLILISNRPPADLPEVRALATRTDASSPARLVVPGGDPSLGEIFPMQFGKRGGSRNVVPVCLAGGPVAVWLPPW